MNRLPNKFVVNQGRDSKTFKFFNNSAERLNSWIDNRVAMRELTRIDQRIFKDIGTDRCRAVLLKN